MFLRVIVTANASVQFLLLELPLIISLVADLNYKWYCADETKYLCENKIYFVVASNVSGSSCASH